MKLSEVALHAKFKQLEDICKSIGAESVKVMIKDGEPRVFAVSTAEIELPTLSKLPVEFESAGSNFNMVNCFELTTLEGFPKHVQRSSSISNMPKLTSLKGMEKVFIKDSFWIYDMPNLQSLEFMPECTSLRIVGCPKILNDLRGIEKHLKFGRDHSNITLECAEVQRGGIGLLLVKNLTLISDYNVSKKPTRQEEAFTIIDKYLERLMTSMNVKQSLSIKA